MAAALALPPQAGSMEASERGAGGDTRAPQGRGSPAEREREAALLQQLLRRRGPEPGPALPALPAAGGEEGPGPGPGELPLAELVRGLRGESPALRGEALRGLRRRLARPGPGAQALRALVEHGLESAEPALRTATALLLPALLGPPLPRGLDLGDLTLSLARKLGAPARPGGGPGEEAAAAFSSLRQLGETLGPERFHGYLGRLPSALRAHYNRLLEARLGEDLCGGGDTAGARPAEQDPLSTNLKFGLIPQELHGRLLDQEDYKNRTQAVEELKQVLTDVASASLASTPAPSLLGLISFLYTLLDDSNFKVVHGTLEVLHLLALRLGERVQAYLGPLVSAAAKVLGDNKLAIRQEYSQLFWCLMKAVGPQQVLCLLLQPEHLQHKNSKVREEVVNICIGSLLTYPSEDFDLPKLAFGLAPALVDSKRRVRHAALEAFAVLASSMGSGRTSLLFKAVDAVELQDNGDGVMHAVQARLARKTLPKLTDQGFVEYAVPMPSSAHGRGVHLPHGADTDWLLAGNRTQSAHSYCGDHTRDATQNYGSHSPYTDQGICPRRVLSAGKGKNKLPWENERTGGTGGCSGNQTPFTKGIEQFCPYNDFLHSPKLRSSQGMPVSDDLFFSRKKASRNLFQNSLDLNSEHSPVCPGGVGSHQPHISGKCGQLGYSQIRGKSGSVGSDLQLLGLNNHRQDKGENAQEKHSPIQLKPALVRSPASRRGLNGTKPVPPIPRGASPLPDKSELNTAGQKNEESEDIWKSEKDKKLAADLSELNVNDKESDQEEMQSSLRSLRNSAAKKRAKLSGSTSDLESPDSALKLDLTMDSPSRTSSPNVSSYSESGVYSQESLTSPVSTTPQGKTTSSDIFPLLGCKSCPARLSSARNRSTNIVEQSSSAGITFHDKSTSNVSIIGQRLNYGNGSGDYEDDKQREVSPCVFKGQNKEHQRHCKPTKGFTGSTSSLQQINNLDFISPSALSEDSVVIVGKGVFGSPPSAPLTYSQSMISCVENGDVLSLKQGIEPLSGIYGRAVQQNSAPFLDTENEKDMKVAMSKSARDKMRQKKKEEKEQSHKEHQEVNDVEKKERNPWERLRRSEPEKMATESLSFYGDVLITSKNESSFEDVAFSTPLKRTSSLRQTQSSVLLDSDETSPGLRGQYKDRTPSVTHSPEIMDPSELRPFSKPETALTEALRLLADDDWEKKIEGLNFVRCLSAYHADVLTGKLHETSLAVVQEVKNLRSGVSRAAVVCLGDLFTYLKKSMDQELDSTVKVLLHKAGESNTFIREDVDKALKAMVNNVTPARALCSLINGGQSHLHTAVRRCTAQHLSDVVERMGPGRILSGIKDVTDRILPAVAKFAQDGSQETRYYGRKMLFSMMTHPDFDKMLEKYVPSKDLPYIKESVSGLRQKGLGEMPLDTPSAKGRRSHTGSIGHSRSSSTSRDALNITEREITEVREITRKPVARNSLESAEYVKVITSLLNAKDFRDRINGIKQLLSDTENNQDLVVANIVKIFDAFKSRLHDSNSKVNQVALETMYKMIPLLKDNLSPVINMLIPAMVDNNLNSKNPGIYAAATNVIQALCQHLDNYLLLQPFCTKAQFLNGKAKQDMTEKLADLVMELYPRKPHAIEQKVLVVLWHLLGNMTNSGSLPGAGGNIRTATAKLSKALFAQMGQSLLIQAASQPPHIKKNLEEFLDIAT
ncbi:TOG array regulator of axonemal microtubules protein 1 isoform X6 [Chelonia mydas]|uniref:TOG array regulator of axonemal microtubules protein 1 isoform X6 n=1 Tax=Chelonia mydas TaxID=8469 RepID=UPI001CA9737F|nr:TOG array regulator of axonemal microtubules protein 1 isoform X6 [Chelonia mydas]